VSTATIDPLAISRALLNLTARSWGVEQAIGCTAATGVAVEKGYPRFTKRRSTLHTTTWTSRGADSADTSVDQWPYWPSYPGLAAHWR
jgi:hypothetical protein